MNSSFPTSPPPQGPIGFDYHRPLPAPLAAARRASVMLWIFGGLCLLCGVCLATVVWFAPMDQLLRQMREISPEQAQQFSTPQMQTLMRVGYSVFGSIGSVIGIALLGTAWFVRQGRRWAVLTALVAFAPVLIWAIVTIFGGVLGLARGAMIGAAQLILGMVVAGLIGLTISWLVQALRASGAADQQRHIEQRYWQFMQQQQTGFGYGSPGQQPSVNAPLLNLPPPPPPPSQQEQPPAKPSGSQ